MILLFFTTAQQHVIKCKIFISQFPLVAALSQSCVLDIDEPVQGWAEILTQFSLCLVFKVLSNQITILYIEKLVTESLQWSKTKYNYVGIENSTHYERTSGLTNSVVNPKWQDFFFLQHSVLSRISYLRTHNWHACKFQTQVSFQLHLSLNVH